jgi:ribosome-binding protein aMBF1 (putative translation factor)
MTELKAKGHEEYRALAERYEALVRESREAQTAVQADLAAVRVSVEAIASMMRDVS